MDPTGTFTVDLASTAFLPFLRTLMVRGRGEIVFTRDFTI
jgi:hypothetical protein